MTRQTSYTDHTPRQIDTNSFQNIRITYVTANVVIPHPVMNSTTTTTTTILRPFVRDYPGEPISEETLTHPPSWSSSNLYQLLSSTVIHSILPVRITCLAIFLHNLSPCPLWSTSWSGALHLIFHTFLHPISVFFPQHMPYIATCFAVVPILYHLFPVFLSTPYLELYLLP